MKTLIHFSAAKIRFLFHPFTSRKSLYVWHKWHYPFISIRWYVDRKITYYLEYYSSMYISKLVVFPSFKRFERKENMAKAMLLHWDREEGNNVENLITKLQEMSCDRVAKIFQDEIDEKGKNCNCPDCRSIS